MLKEAESAGGGPLPEEAAEVVKQVGSKTFLLQDGVWIDTAFDPSKMTTVKVGFGSDEYFDLLSANAFGMDKPPEDPPSPTSHTHNAVSPVERFVK